MIPDNAAYAAKRPKGSVTFYLDSEHREIGSDVGGPTKPPFQWGPMLLRNYDVTVINAALVAAQRDLDRLLEV